MNIFRTAPKSENSAERNIDHYWRRYYSNELADWMQGRVRSVRIPSTGIELNLDIYRQPRGDAPVIVFNHGGGGYSRMFGVLIRELYERGFTVVLPDQRGQGYSEGDRGDFTIPQLIENICDAFAYVRKNFAGQIVLAGASFGGGATYMAAARMVRRHGLPGSTSAVPDAVVCHNLFDFGRIEEALALSRMGFLLRLPGLAAGISRSLRWLARLAPRVRIPFRLVANFRHMVDSRDTDFYNLWKRDPIPLRFVTLRYLASVGSSPPAIPFEEYEKPVLVINPVRDLMTPCRITRRNFERLGGPKEYAELEYGHWSVSPEFAHAWVDLLVDFVSRRIRKAAPDG